MDSHEKLGQMLREANLQVMQLQQQVTSLHSEMSALKSRSLKEEEVSRLKLGEVQQKIDSLDKWNLTIRDLDDIPGIRTPRWYEVDVDLAANATQTTFNSAEISPDGPFIITQIQPYFEITDTDAANFPVSAVAPTGRIVPCSAYPLLLSQLGSEVLGASSDLATFFNGATGPYTEIPELSFQFEIAGSGRFWTNRAIPAAALYGESNPLYTGIAGWVERTDRIVVHVTPTATLPYAGRVRMVFHGYQILGHVNIGEALGY
jgi:hypothetical protein